MNLPGDPDQALFVYTTRAGSPSHDAMRLLSSWLATPEKPAGRETRPEDVDSDR
jgi:hypothetical protein